MVIRTAEPATINQIKRDLIQKIGALGKETYANPRASIVLTAILMNPGGITQDELMNLTGLPRTTVSEALASLRPLDFVAGARRPRQRKRFYHSTKELKDAFRIYLQHTLQNFEQSTRYVQEVLDRVQNLAQEGHDIPEIAHFARFLRQFHQSNSFVITHFQQYLARDFTPRKVPGQERNQIMQKIGQLLGATLNQPAREVDIIPTTTGQGPPNTGVISRLDVIKKAYVRGFMTLMEKTEKNPLYSVLVNLLYIEQNPPTQDRIRALVDIPRSTLSDALRKVQQDGLIKSLPSRQNGKIQYFPSIPRQLLLPFKFFSQARSLLEILGVMTKIKQEISDTTPESQGLRVFVENAMEEYDLMIDFLIFLVRKLTVGS